MIDEKLKKYLASQPLQTTLKVLVSLLKEITGKKLLIIVIDDNEKNLTIRGTAGIITNEKIIELLHSYFCNIDINLRENKINDLFFKNLKVILKEDDNDLN